CFIMESSDTIALSSLPSIIRDGKDKKVEETHEDAMIDFKDIQNSILQKDPKEAQGHEYQFTFAKAVDGEVKMDFQEAKDKFEYEFIIQALKVNKGRINQTALNANIPKKTLLRKIEKYEINPKDFY